MTARQWDIGFGAAFAALGGALAIAGWRLPEGIAGVPGPGVFPLLIGAALVVLGAALALSAGRGGPGVYWEKDWRDPAVRRVAGILALLAAYAALWDAVPFIWRTPLLLVAIYRLTGEPWLRSLFVSAAATALLAVVFQALLRVRL